MLRIITHRYKAVPGVTRTLAFSRYMREFGWDVSILTVRPSAYERVFLENESLIPSWVKVGRAWAVDAQRTLSIKGRYLLSLALPDRWQSWIIGGYLKGSEMIKQSRPDVVMTTYPIPSAHMIGYLLNKKYKVPWVAEFRDPMLQPTYPGHSWERWAYKKIEDLVFRHASNIVVTTSGCRDVYVDRYPDFATSKIRVVPNGYDPEMFSALEHKPNEKKTQKLVLLHSGVLYPNERNPAHFFQALKNLKQNGFLSR